MASTATDGKFGDGVILRFPDVAERTVGSVTEYLGEAFTVGGWFRHGADTGVAGFLQYVDAFVAWQVVFTPDVEGSMVEVIFSLTALDQQTLVTSGAFVDHTEWQHVAVTYEVGGNFSIYANGELVETTVATLSSRAATMGVGSKVRVQGGNYDFDDWFTVPRILSPGEIAALQTAEVSTLL